MSDQILAQPELAAIHVDEDSEDISRGDVISRGRSPPGRSTAP